MLGIQSASIGQKRVECVDSSCFSAKLLAAGSVHPATHGGGENAQTNADDNLREFAGASLLREVDETAVTCASKLVLAAAQLDAAV